MRRPRTRPGSVGLAVVVGGSSGARLPRTLTPSAHLYSYLGPADMVAHVSAVQNSASVL